MKKAGLEVRDRGRNRVESGFAYRRGRVTRIVDGSIDGAKDRGRQGKVRC